MGSVRTYRLALGVTLCLLVAIGLIVLKPAPQDGPPYASGSFRPDGSKAVVMLLEEKGKRVKEWRQPMRYLPVQTGQALIVLEPADMVPRDSEAILDWVAIGNDLLLFMEIPEDWTEFSFYRVHNEEQEAMALEGPLLEEGSTGLAKSPYRLEEDGEMEVLFSDELGVLAGRRQYDEGTISLFLVPEWMTNKSISAFSHFEAVWPYLQEDWSVVWMDEYHHGDRVRPGVFAVYPGWLLIGSIQLFLALLLYLWWRGKRFGPVYTLREWTVRRGDETLVAVSTWYERKRLALDALRHREAYLKQLLYERWGIHHRADPHEIIHAARSRWNEKDTAKLVEVLQRLEQANTAPSYTPKQLLMDSIRLDEITKRLEKE